MNILVGKIGRALFFNESNRKSLIGGDEALPLLVINLAKRYPKNTYYVISKNDISKTRSTYKKTKLNMFMSSDDEANTSEQLPTNIIDVWEGVVKTPLNTITLKRESVMFKNDCLIDKIKDIEFGFGLIFNGPQPSSCLNETTKVDNKHEFTSPPDYSYNYVAPVIKVLNYTKVPWFMIDEDPRYIKNKLVRDCINVPLLSLSQINGSFQNTTLKNYPGVDQEKVFYDTRHFYAKPETIFLSSLKRVDFRNSVKTNEFIMTLNGPISTEKPEKTTRLKFLNDWVWKRYPDLKVYGKWHDNFKSDKIENVPISSIEPEMFNTKYTLIVPISDQKDFSKFITQKFWKTIYYGIIPFFAPNYDTDKLFDIPDILRPKNFKEFEASIEFLNNNEDEYRKILNHLYSLIPDDMFTGDHFINNINNYMNKALKYDLKGKPQT